MHRFDPQHAANPGADAPDPTVPGAAWFDADENNSTVPDEPATPPSVTKQRQVPVAKRQPVQAEVHQDALQFVRTVLNEGIARGASDVHFEPRTSSYWIRLRIDGVMVRFAERPLEEYHAILNTTKVLADIDIAEHALPHDGHIELEMEQVDLRQSTSVAKQQPTRIDVPGTRFYDIRVSTFPSVNGEVIVMRILNRSDALLTVEQLGMDQESLAMLRQILMASYGMFLITGPTGSGKTTTLYSILEELKSEDRNMITLEDPIEFHLDWLRQCEIREDRGFTFERAMSSVLRQDPDVLMVGEIRDAKTAEYAVRAALVGHLVGSTIHANTTTGTIARLLDLGIQRSLLAHSVNGIIAQRLVRRTCEHCKASYQPSELYLAHFGLDGHEATYYRGAGCEKCGGTGYKGRQGIYSVMVMTDELRNLIFEQRPLAELQDRAIQGGMRTLKMDAARKILQGLTTVEEAARVV